MGSCTPIWALADLLNARDNIWKPLLLIDANSYLDDSGTHRDSVVTIIAGYVATKAVWEKIEDQWCGVLKPFREKGVHCFHATECLAQAGQFERLEHWQCQYIYKQLSDILETATEAQPVVAAVSSEDWEAVTDANFKVLFESAYDFCIDRAISQLVNWSSNNAGGNKVPVVIARQKEHEEETNRTVASWFKVDPIGDRIGPLSFAFPDSLIPLQTADMLAHEQYRHSVWVHAMENGLDPPPKPLHPPALLKIMRNRRVSGGGQFDREFLESYATGIRSVDSV